MSVNSYLSTLAHTAVIRDTEKESIQRSIVALEGKLSSYFSGEIKYKLVFGSYTRGTILPRAMDEHSDIDYMVVFNDSSYRPQTYLDKLRRFVSIYYSKSEISQSNPTIVLSLNHIKFELVPAIEGWFSGLQIPAKRSDLDDWISTNPNDFNQTLIAVNQSNQNLIKPMLRLVKYWNAKNNYPFPSFELEKRLAERSYFLVGGLLGQASIKSYFFEAMKSLELSWDAPQYKKDALYRAHQLINSAQHYLNQGLDSVAEGEIKKLLPEPSIQRGLIGSILSR